MGELWKAPKSERSAKFSTSNVQRKWSKFFNFELYFTANFTILLLNLQAVLQYSHGKKTGL